MAHVLQAAQTKMCKQKYGNTVHKATSAIAKWHECQSYGRGETGQKQKSGNTVINIYEPLSNSKNGSTYPVRLGGTQHIKTLQLRNITAVLQQQHYKYPIPTHNNKISTQINYGKNIGDKIKLDLTISVSRNGAQITNAVEIQ